MDNPLFGHTPKRICFEVHHLDFDVFVGSVFTTRHCVLFVILCRSLELGSVILGVLL